MTRIDHRIAGSEQRHKGWLRPAQLEGNLIVAVGGHLLEVAIPRFAWIETKLLARLADQQVPGAFDVPCGQRPAVVPFDALAQWERQLGPVLAPGPAGGEIGNERLHAVLFYMLVEHDEIVEQPHRRPRRDGIHLLQASTCSAASRGRARAKYRPASG